MMVSNFSTESYDGNQLQYESYDGNQLQYWILWWQTILVLNPVMASNFSTESYDGKQLQ